VKHVPYANNQGVRIRYEVEGSGSPLVLLSGFREYLEEWRERGYVDSLKDKHKLILIDLRGHGGSDKPHDPEAYRPKLLAEDVVAVLDDLGISKAHFLGYSLDGRIGFGLAKYASARFLSFIIGGQEPGEVGEEGTRWWLQLLGKGTDAVIAMLETEVRMTPEMRARALADDAEALSALLSSPDYRSSLEDVLSSITVPCLIFIGEADPRFPGAKECVKHIRGAEFVSFPGLNHRQVDLNSHLVLPHIIKFLENASQRYAREK
jgi:pimeloyl-ACP methyl ester carboxylesterase